jgi:hypothetical protein
VDAAPCCTCMRTLRHSRTTTVRIFLIQPPEGDGGLSPITLWEDFFAADGKSQAAAQEAARFKAAKLQGWRGAGCPRARLAWRIFASLVYTALRKGQASRSLRCQTYVACAWHAAACRAVHSVEACKSPTWRALAGRRVWFNGVHSFSVWNPLGASTSGLGKMKRCLNYLGSRSQLPPSRVLARRCLARGRTCTPIQGVGAPSSFLHACG